MRRASLLTFLQVLLPVFILVAYVLYPFTKMAGESVSIDGVLSLSRYTDLLSPSNHASWEAVRNSVLVSLLSVLFSALIGTVMAFAFTHLSFPLRKALSQLAVLPIALPPLVGVIAFLFVFGESGFLPRGLQSLLGLHAVPFSLEGINAIVAVHAYSFYVYFYLFVSNALRRVDASMIEAAASLGASQRTTMFRVVLPELRPALAGAAVLTFMASMASFSAPLLFGGDARFMTTQIYSSKLNGNLDIAAAQAVGLTLVSLLFFVLLRLSKFSEGNVMRSKGAPRFQPMHVSPWTRRMLIAFTMVILVLGLLPIVTIVLVSFVKEGSWTWQVLPTTYTIGNYTSLLTEPRIFEPIVNSLLMTGLTVVASLLIGVSAAFAIVKGRRKGGKVLIDLFLTMPFAIPGTVVALGLILAFNEPTFFSGFTILVGTFWILPLAYTVRTFPLIVRSTSAALAQFDDSLHEAGESFGAGPVRRFLKIGLPIILPAITSGAVLTAIAALGEFVSSILLYTYSSRPISIEILSQLRGYHFGGAAVYCVFLLLLIFGLSALATHFANRGGQSGRSFEF